MDKGILDGQPNGIPYVLPMAGSKIYAMDNVLSHTMTFSWGNALGIPYQIPLAKLLFVSMFSEF